MRTGNIATLVRDRGVLRLMLKNINVRNACALRETRERLTMINIPNLIRNIQQAISSGKHSDGRAQIELATVLRERIGLF